MLQVCSMSQGRYKRFNYDLRTRYYYCEQNYYTLKGTTENGKGSNLP